jgi:hypothetical protein
MEGLGEYLQQLTWTEKAARHLKGGGSEWMRLQGAYYRSLGFCMIGENRKGLEEIEAFDTSLPIGRPQWMVQSSAVMVADIFYAGGEVDRASRVASEGFRLAGVVPLSQGYAGIIARWVERTGGLAEDSSLPIIEGLCDALEDYDLIDQAEILCARERLAQRTGRVRPECRNLLLEKLSRLPSPVEEQLRRLGALG